MCEQYKLISEEDLFGQYGAQKSLLGESYNFQ